MNKCIFIDASCNLSIRDIPEKYYPKGGQALIKVQYSAIAPADLGHGKDMGMNNNVCGYEICGIVIETGPTSRYAVGDIAFGSNYARPSKPAYHGGHQNFAILESDPMSMKLPAGLPQADAAALGIMVRTAADALINVFGLPFPAIDVFGPPATGGILIWGGASSVGTAAIQLARVMGLKPIFTTASPANHRELMSLGATQCFDYRDPDIVNIVRAAAEKNADSIKYVLDAVCKRGSPGTVDLCESIVTAPDVTFAGALPQIRNPRWMLPFAARAYDIDVPSLPGGVKANMEWELRLEKVVSWVAINFGKEFRIPNVQIIKGAEMGIQAIKDVYEGKVSFAKVVIEHPL